MTSLRHYVALNKGMKVRVGERKAKLLLSQLRKNIHLKIPQEENISLLSMLPFNL